MVKDELDIKYALLLIADECKRQPTAWRRLGKRKDPKTVKVCTNCRAISFCKAMAEKSPCDWQMDGLKWRT